MPNRSFRLSPAGILASALGIALIALAAGFFYWIHAARGFSCRAQPTFLESFMATSLRRMAMPAQATALRNPFPATPAALQLASEHFAAHCAVCHNNNGDGQTMFGQNLYPHPPDLRRLGTQTDGDLFYMIRNGIRLSGMPAWSDDTHEETWQLVNFIRHLPRLTPAELSRMKQYDPKTKYPEPLMGMAGMAGAK